MHMEIGEKRARNRYSSAGPHSECKKVGEAYSLFSKLIVTGNWRWVGGYDARQKKIFPDRLRRQDVTPNLASRRILKEEVEVEGRHGKINFARQGL